jgi:surface antigen
MSSFDNRQISVTNELQIPGLVNELSPVNQLPFPDSTPPPGKTTRNLELDSSPNVTEALSDPGTTSDLYEYFTSPNITRVLLDVITGKLSFPPAETKTTVLRQPIVIRGAGKKKLRATHAPKTRKWIISIAAILLLLCITLGTTLAASPLNGGIAHIPNPIGLVNNLVHNSNNSPSLIAQQATATAVVHQDGYDPSTGMGVSTQAGVGGLNRFAFGQCTYWANMRYHTLTGYWVPWLGNAYQWAYGASVSGWIVSSKPNPNGPSIIVLQPYVEGASGWGHVAIVEKINADGSVYTSNYNWYGSGGWDILSYWTFTPGPGVSFVWHP